jgi:predicted deacylase
MLEQPNPALKMRPETQKLLMISKPFPPPGFAPYPIEVKFPSLERWRISETGIDYVHSFESGKPGPHVMILALVHGNEVSGAIAVDTLLDARVRPLRGRLSFAFANVAAYENFDVNNPDANRYVDEDMNRVWNDSALFSSRESVELRRARELQPFVQTVDLLLDIHSMHEESAPLMMCGPLQKGRVLAEQLGVPEVVVVDSGHANGRRLRDSGGFGSAASTANALLLEAGQHFSRKSRDVALDTACRFLLHSGVVNIEQVALFLTTNRPKRQRVLEVTHPIVAKTTDFRFTEPFTGLECIPMAGTVIAQDGGEPVVTPYDNCIIVQPSLRQLAPGVTVARLGRELT